MSWLNAWSIALAMASAQAAAAPLASTGDILLVDSAGHETRIGTATFAPATSGDRYGFSVEIDGTEFTDQFLSMRPFRCLVHAEEWMCHLPYPYSLDRTIAADDLTDLEYSLLFLRKTPAEFGIDPWNGLYYRLELQPDGTIRGTLTEGDLSNLAAPPDAGARPIALDEFIPAAPGRQYPGLIIRARN